MLPLVLLYTATAFFNKWPVESLWILALITIGPIWMFIREVFPTSLKSLKTNSNILFYFVKKLKIKDRQIEQLRSEITELNQELAGLHSMWMNSKPVRKRSPFKKPISSATNHTPLNLTDLGSTEVPADTSPISAEVELQDFEMSHEDHTQITMQKINSLFRSSKTKKIDFENIQDITSVDNNLNT